MSEIPDTAGRRARQLNIIDATNGAAAIGDGARAVHVGAGGTYIEQQIIIQQPPPPPAEPNLFQVPFPRSDHFVGREADLAQIHALLSGPERRPVGLCGLGGIGKTQLAVEYAYRHRGDYADGIFWLTAADPWTWQAGLAEIATRLGLRVPDPDSSDAQMRLARELAAYLNGHPNSLLISDNVETPADLNVSRVQDFIFAALGCRTLFTTRRRAADLPFAWLEVGRLPEDASLALLLRHESRRRALDPAHPDHPAARELCRRLGYLPLTLELAGAFLARNLRVTIPAYLARIGKEGVLATVDKTHLRPEDLPTEHDPSIVATLAMQWEALADADARRALQTAALLGEAEQIPRARLALLTGLPDTAEEGYASPLEDALASLRDLSLAEELTADEVRLHPLVREFVAGQIVDRSAFIEAAVAEMSEALWDVERLEAEARARGVDAVVADLRATMALTPSPAPERRERGGEAGVKALLRALDLDSHILRGWNRETEPAFFLQQWRNRCFEMGWDEPVRQAEALLQARRLPYLRELFGLETENPALLRTLTGHAHHVQAIAMTPDGHAAVSGGDDATIRIWNLTTGVCLHTIDSLVPKDFAGGVLCVTITPDGRIAISGGDDGHIRGWDTMTAACLWDLEGHAVSVAAIAVTPDGRVLVSGADDGVVKVWDLTTGTCLYSLEGHREQITTAAVTPDGQIAISGSENGTLMVWNLIFGTCIHTLTGHQKAICAVAITADGLTAISASYDGTVNEWNLTTGDCTRARTEHLGDLTALALSSDLQMAIAGSQDRSIKIWDLRTGNCRRAIEGHTGLVSTLVMAFDGRILVSGSWDGSLKIWDVTTEESLSAMKRHKDRVVAVAMTSDARSIVTGSWDGTFGVWSSVTGACVRVIEAARERIASVAVTPDNQFAICGSWDATIKIWDLKNGRNLRTLEGHTSPVYFVAAAPDSRTVISCEGLHTLKTWDLTTGSCLLTIKGDTGQFTAVGLTPDGWMAVSRALNDNALSVWDLMTGKHVRNVGRSWENVWKLVVTPDGQTIIAGSLEGTIEFHDLATGVFHGFFHGHARPIEGMMVTPDGRILISMAQDALRVWSLVTGGYVELQTYLRPDVPFTAGAIALDSRHMVVGDALGAVHFLEFVRWDQ